MHLLLTSVGLVLIENHLLEEDLTLACGKQNDEKEERKLRKPPPGADATEWSWKELFQPLQLDIERAMGHPPSSGSLLGPFRPHPETSFGPQPKAEREDPGSKSKTQEPKVRFITPAF